MDPIGSKKVDLVELLSYSACLKAQNTQQLYATLRFTEFEKDA